MLNYFHASKKNHFQQHGRGCPTDVFFFGFHHIAKILMRYMVTHNRHSTESPEFTCIRNKNEKKPVPLPFLVLSDR